MEHNRNSSKAAKIFQKNWHVTETNISDHESDTSKSISTGLLKDEKDWRFPAETPLESKL